MKKEMAERLSGATVWEREKEQATVLLRIRKKSGKH